MLRKVAVLASLAAALATSRPEAQEVRAPCDQGGATPTWDPNVPLLMAWRSDGEISEGANLRDSITLETEGGEPIDFFSVSPEPGVIHLCPVGGLPADEEIRWVVRQFANRDPNHLPVPYWISTGTVRFRTLPTSDHPPIDSEQACRRFDDWQAEIGTCGGEPRRDTGFR